MEMNEKPTLLLLLLLQLSGADLRWYISHFRFTVKSKIVATYKPAVNAYIL